MSAALILSDGDETLDLVGTPGTGAGIWLDVDGFDPPLPGRENTYAESADSEGRRRIRSRAPNPEGKVALVIAAATEALFWGYVDQVQELVESAHRAKGTLRYEPARDGEPVTFDLEAARVTGLPQRGTTVRVLVCTAEIEFECRPYGRLDPVTWFTDLSVPGPIGFIPLEEIPGHVDAYAALTLVEASSQNRDSVEVAIQPDFDPNNAEPLLIDGDTLEVSDFAGATTTQSGSYSTNVVEATLTTSPVVVCSTGEQPHAGKWRVNVRAYGSTADIRVRLAWKVGDGPVTRERWVDLPGATDWFDLNLQTIDIGELPAGHSWTGYIEAYATSGLPTLKVDFVDFMPGRWGRAYAAPKFETPTSFVARDEFDHAGSPALTGQTLPVGGTWADAGSANGLSVDSAVAEVKRSASSDADPGNGFALAGTTTRAALICQADFYVDTPAASVQALLVRWVDASNWFIVYVGVLGGFGGGNASIRARKYVGAVSTITNIVDAGSTAPAAWYTMRCACDESGRYLVWFAPRGADPGNPVLVGQDVDLATGGALASGRQGLYDRHDGGGSNIRVYDNFGVAPFDLDTDLYAGQSARFTHDAAYRENAAGTSEGRVPTFEGKHLTIPPATRADRKSRLVVRARSFDGQSGLPDAGLTDDLTASLDLTPRVVLLGPAIGGS